MKVSISKSVGRAFDVLDMFRASPIAMSASQVRQRLDCPHSSAMAVVQNLTDLGYLSWDPETRRYFPTRKLDWISTLPRPATRRPAGLAQMAALIAEQSGHTTTITSRISIFLNVVLVRQGASVKAATVSRGVDLPLGRTVPGLAILSLIDDDKVAEAVSAANRWSDKTKTNCLCNLNQVMRAVSRVRQDGAAFGVDPTGTGNQIIALPMISPIDQSPLAVSVVGHRDLIGPKVAAIRRIMEQYIHNSVGEERRCA